MSKVKSHDKKLKGLNDKIDAWFNYYADNIKTYQYNVSFNQGDQWDPDTVAYYSENGKAILTNNLLNRYTKQIVGEQLRTTPEMQIVVDADSANKKIIALRQDILRTIQLKNNSKEAYEVAFECALTGGWGALYYYNDYSDGQTFHQEVKQDVVKEPTMCFWDPKSNEKSKADGDYCGIVTYMRRKDFERKYPDAEFTQDSWNVGVIDPAFFVPQNNEEDELISVADIYEKRYTKIKIVQVAPTLSGEDYEVIKKSDFDKYVEDYISTKQMINMAMGIEEEILPPEIVQERTVDDYKIKCYRMTKCEILEEYDFPSKFLPVIYVDGYSYTQKGKQIVKSFTQDAHDAQKALNYFWSELAQAVRTYRREQVWGTNKMFAGSLGQMRNPEKPAAFMAIQPDPTFNGGVPVFRDPKPLPMELLEACEAARQNLINILGRAEASQGQPGNATSGQQEAMQQQQQNTIVNKWFDGLVKAIEAGAFVVNDMIGNLYDQPRDIMLYKEDNKSYKTKLNVFNPEVGDIDNEVKQEDYGIRVSVGANYEQQRMIEREWILELLNASQNPAFSKLADILASQSDLPDTAKIVERMKSMVDPAILAKEEGSPPPPPPPPPPAFMLEQQKMQVQQMEAQAKLAQAQQKSEQQQLQAQVDQMKAKMQFFESVMDLQAKGMQTNAEIQRAEIEFGKDLQKGNIDMIGHGVKAMGHVKDLAAMMQPNDEGNSLAEQGA